MTPRHHSRPIVAEISTAALAHNLAHIKARAADTRHFAVVKADAYGHGIANVYEGLRGADGFACLEIAEAQTLRDLGWRGPILLLEGAFDARDLEWCSRLGLMHTLHTEVQIDWLAAHKTLQPQHVCLKMNSGMNRLGFAANQYRTFYARVQALTQVESITHMTHFSDADTPKGIAGQLAVFDKTTAGLDGERCLPNSAAVLRHSQKLSNQTDWSRVGIALYGASPDYPEHDGERWGLQPAMRLRSKIVGVQDLRKGDTVGYGSGFVAKTAMRVGVVACGYADGYPRHAGNAPLGKGEPDARGALGAPVLVCGVRTRTLGRISMDMLCVDLTHIEAAQVGSPVTLWGVDASGALLSVDEVALASLTIGYELLCAVTPRVPRVVVSDEGIG